jgi:hypothetical protein
MGARSSIRRFVRSLRPIDVVPALALALYGAAWIALHASARGATHNFFQAIVLVESVVAILLVRRKPLASLLGILIAHLLFALEPLTLPPALYALATVAALSARRTLLIGIAASTTVLLVMPLVHGDSVSVPSAAWHLAAVTASVLAGLLVRNRADLTTQQQGGDA